MTDSHEAIAVVEEPPALSRVDAARMHPLVRSAMATPAALSDPQTLRELLAVQREWEAGEAKKAFTRAKAALKADLPTVLAKDKLVEFDGKSGSKTSYRHTTLAAAMDAVTEPLVKHGFDASWKTKIVEKGEVEVTCVLTHSEGHSDSTALRAPPDASGRKNPAQAVASTVTILERYTLLALLGIATRDQVEPEGRAPAATGVDPARNMAAVRALAKAGISKETAEEHVGRSVSEWTYEDRMDLRALLEERNASNGADGNASPAGDDDDSDGGDLTPEEEEAMEAHFRAQEEGS